MSFVFATFAAIWFLNERVSAVRWIGVVLIVIGAAFISYSQHAKENPRRQRLPNPGYGEVILPEFGELSAANRFFCNSINAPIFPAIWQRPKTVCRNPDSCPVWKAR